MPIQTMLITGCSKGIGRALANTFAENAIKVYAVGRNEAALRSLAQTSEYIIPVVADITDPAGREKIYAALKDESSFSIIHNAGISESSHFEALPETSLRQQFETNFFAPVLLTQNLLPKLSGQRVLNISSGAALQGHAYKLSYCSSKAAMHRAIESLHQEFYAHDIYFANLRPGMVDTPLVEHLRNESTPTRDFYIRIHKEGLLIAPETVAQFVAWVMLKTKNAEFAETFWNIDDPAYQAQWAHAS